MCILRGIFGWYRSPFGKVGKLRDTRQLWIGGIHETMTIDRVEFLFFSTIVVIVTIHGVVVVVPNGLAKIGDNARGIPHLDDAAMPYATHAANGTSTTSSRSGRWSSMIAPLLY